MHLKNVFSYYRMCSLTIALCVATRHTLNRHTRARCICFLIFSFFVSLLRRRTRDMRDLSSLFFFFSFFSFSESLLRRHTGTTHSRCSSLPCVAFHLEFDFIFSFHLIFPSHFSISFFHLIFFVIQSEVVLTCFVCSLALCWLVFCALFFLSISFFHLIFFSHFLVVLTCFVCSLALCWLVFCALQLSSYIKYSRRCS